MPWRLIAFIIIFAVFIIFIGFNLENKCDISFGFTKIPDVQVFFTIFVSFALGLLFALPFKLRTGKKRNETAKDKKQESKTAKDNFSGHDGGDYGID